MPPFFCDHGHGIRLGEEVFVNANCTFLDSGTITIGARTKIGPNCQLYTPQHPLATPNAVRPWKRAIRLPSAKTVGSAGA